MYCMFRNAKPYVCSELQAGRPGWTTVLSCVFISFMFALNMLGDLVMCQLDDKHECWHVCLSNASQGYSQQLVSIANWAGSKRWRWDPVTPCVSQCCLFYVSDDDGKPLCFVLMPGSCGSHQHHFFKQTPDVSLLWIRIKASREKGESWWPVVTRHNLRSVRIKLEEVAARGGCDGESRQNNITCLTETWLKHHTALTVSGCLTIRANRDEHRSVKSIWAGLGFSVGYNWEKPFCIFKQGAHPGAEV